MIEPTREQDNFARDLDFEEIRVTMREDHVAVVTGIYTVKKNRRHLKVREIFYVDPEGQPFLPTS